MVTRPKIKGMVKTIPHCMKKVSHLNYNITEIEIQKQTTSTNASFPSAEP